jgi:hypothetical protein
MTETTILLPLLAFAAVIVIARVGDCLGWWREP